MARPSKVKGRCFKETCQRRAKIEFACRMCELVIKSCDFHRERAMGQLKEHVITDHPAEYRAAKQEVAELEHQPPIQYAPTVKTTVSR